MPDASRETQLRFDLAQLDGQLRWIQQCREELQLEYDQLVRERDASVMVPLPEDPTPLETALIPLVNDFLTGIRRLERSVSLKEAP